LTTAAGDPRVAEQAIAEAFAAGRMDDALTAAETLNTAQPERPFGWKARGKLKSPGSNCFRMRKGTSETPTQPDRKFAILTRKAQNTPCPLLSAQHGLSNS
jgi:hypothetical protein